MYNDKDYPNFELLTKESNWTIAAIFVICAITIILVSWSFVQI